MNKEFMKMAIELSIESVNKNGGPFGCVIVKNNKIIHTPIPRNFDKIGIMSLSSINI